MSARSCDGWGTILVVLIVTALAGCDADLESGRGGKFRPGLSGTYYALYLEPVVERVDPNVDFAWGEAEPAVGVGADAFSVRWLGQLRGTTTGPYTLSVESDDGVRLWIDGALLVDGWAVRSETRNDTTISLEAGRWVDLRMEYFDSVAAASVRLLWTPPGGAEEVIPSSALRTASSDTVLPGPKPPYTNPTVPYDCPDPGVLRIADDPAEYAMVCTGGRFPIRISRDLVRWADAGTTVLDADKPPWARDGLRNWAPEIHRVGDRFVAYFTTVSGAGSLCIGTAVASNATGPYTVSAGPLVEDGDGVIDATYFEDDDGRRYLFYKIDGNHFSRPTPMFMRELAPDGLSFAPGSTPVQVLSNDAATWEGGVVEAPWVIKRAGMYYLFYSGNVYDERYRTGVARATAVGGPYEKRGEPILQNNEAWVGPGHGSVVRINEVDYFTYHAWPTLPGGGANRDVGRYGLVDRIRWVDGWPQISDGTPSRTPQAWPDGLEP